MWELGLRYENVNQVEQDANRAFQLYKQSADAGNAIGYYLVGHCYQHGISVEENHTLSDENYVRSFTMLNEQLAEADDMILLNFLGSAYFWGDGTERNLEEGFRCYLRSAEMGNPETQCKVGMCYLQGIGVEQDSVVARQWLDKSAAQGWAEAVAKLASMTE